MNQLKQLERHLSVAVTNRDRKELAHILAGYNKMVNIFGRIDVSIPTIKKLILIELEGKQRMFIIEKLVGRLKSKERNHLLTLIKPCLKETSNPKSITTAELMGSSPTSSPALRDEESRIG